MTTIDFIKFLLNKNTNVNEEIEIVLYDAKEECYIDLSLDKINSSPSFLCFNLSDIGETND